MLMLVNKNIEIMIVIKDIERHFEIAITDEIGNFVSGLTVLYELRNSSDDSLIISGTTTEINSTYFFTYTFNTIGDYRLKFITPTYYDNGFYDINVIEDYAKDNDIQTLQSGVTNIETSLTDIELKIKYILGLEQHNFRIINQVYNSDNLLTSSTIRLYNNASDATNNVNAFKEYSMSATYDTSGRITSYKVIEA